MSLILHLMKKDARYLRYELAIYLLLVLLQEAVVLSGVDARFTGAGVAGLTFGFWMLIACQSVLAIVFAVQLVQSDTAIGTTAFWRTRPISTSRLLAAKFALAFAGLLVAPFIFDVLTSLVLGMSTSAAAAGAWSSLFGRAVILVSALALAAVTVEFGRFAISAIAVTVGLVLTQWTMIFFAPQAFALRSDEFSSTLQASRSEVLCLSFIAWGFAVVLHQYLTFQRVRSLILVPVAVVASVATMNLWHVDFRDRPLPLVDRSRVDPERVELWVNPGSVTWQDVSLVQRSTSSTALRIWGQISMSGAPANLFFEPQKAHVTLSFPGRRDVVWGPHDIRAIGRRFPSRHSDDFDTAMLTAIGPFAWTNLDWTQGPGLAAALIDVPESVARQVQGSHGTYSAEVTFNAIGFETAGVMALRSGASYLRSPRGAMILKVSLSRDRCVISLRETSVQTWSPSDTSRLAGRYVLVNTTRKEALLPEDTYTADVLDGNWLNLYEASLRVTHANVTFVYHPAWNGPVIDAAWLSQAELVRVEPVSLGVFAKKLTIDDFVLPARR